MSIANSIDSLLKDKEQGVSRAALKLALKETYNKSLYALAKHGLGYPDINQNTHGGTIRILESDSKRKLIVLPRGCLKSTIGCVSYPIWSMNRNPNIRILIDSELHTNSTTFLREIRQQLVSPNLTKIFGDYKGDTWNESEITIKQRTKNLKEATVTCGGIGTTKVGQHYDLIVHDDMNSPNNSNTPEACRKVIDHFKYNLSILEPNGTMVVIGTRYSELDLIGHIMTNEIGQKGLIA